MADAPLRYSVLLRGPELPETARLAQALAAHRRIMFADAARQAREAWGIMGEGMEEGEGKALAAALDAAGLPSVVLPSGLVEELPAPAAACAMEIEPDGLAMAAKTGERSLILWNRLALVAAAGYKEVTVRKVKVCEGPSMAQKAAGLGLMMTGIPIRLGGKRTETDKVVETAELVFFLELFERKPLRRFRVDAQDFSYACLGERMQYGATENFRTLIETVASKACRATLNRGSRDLIGRKPVAAMGYDSLANLERESRWRLTLESLRNP
ncbi:MAG: hypothetical protein HY748_03555 [Elusimicrobia bacterium]|nr:hypothetical protein [Elusimicrobiota bacterium]